MSNEMVVTVVGRAATTPREVHGDGVPFTSFRLATAPRFFDSRAGQWRDGQTEWLTVKAFRGLAFNVAASVRRGDPVVVHGRLRTEEWVSEAGPRTSLVLDVSAIGHDLARGTTVFAARLNRSPRAQDVPDVGAPAGPSDESGTEDGGAGWDEDAPDVPAWDEGPAQEPADPEEEPAGSEGLDGPAGPGAAGPVRDREAVPVG